ncbi:MAG: S-layer homology domain-containing protein [Clostridiales bacterium]|nr:S-layer homology domain-containing protein [Clostridiales bacterium]
MKKTKKLLSGFLALSMLAGAFPGTLAESAGADYSVSEDYANRYPCGVIELEQSSVELSEDGGVREIKLIRKGGTMGEVSVGLKAIDITAKYGEDYTVTVDGDKLTEDEEYSGTLLENYLEENGGTYITSEDMLEDEEYRELIGYEEPERLSESELADMKRESVALAAERLGISEEKAQSLLVNDTAKQAEEEHTSSVHAFRDSVTGEKTAPNRMEVGDITDPDSVLGSNDRNLEAAAVNEAAVGADIRVSFKDGENEKLIRIRPKDNRIYEAQKLFVLGLYAPEGGAELGDVFDANIIINDNDEIEASYIGFLKTSVTVSRSDKIAEIELVRTGNIEDYAAVSVYTCEGTAKDGEDYIGIDSGGTFMPGEEKKIIAIPLKTAAHAAEEDISFTVAVECDTHNVTLTENRVEVIIKGSGKPSEKTGASTEEISLFAADSAVATPEPIVICGNLPSQDVVSQDREWAYASSLRTWTIGKTGDHIKNFGGDINFAGIERIEVDIDGNKGEYKLTADDSYKKLIFGYSSADTSCTANSVNLGGLEIGSSKKRTLTYVLPKNDSLSDYDYRRQWQLLNTKGLTIIGRNIGYFPGKEWKKVTDDIFHNGGDLQIKEIRLYPIAIEEYVVDNTPSSPADPVLEYPYSRTREITASYSEYDGLTDPIKTISYNSGTVTIEDYAYINKGLSGSYAPSKEAEKHKAQLDGFYRVYTGTTSDHHIVRKLSDKLPLGYCMMNDDRQYLLDELFVSIYRRPLYLFPSVGGREINKVNIAKYDADMGVLSIGGRGYNDCTIERTKDGFTWNEGDELILTVTAKDGYHCDKIRISRTDGTAEEIEPGQKTILTDGMTIEPLFEKYDITVTVDWSEVGTASEFESREDNLKDYTLGYSYSGTNEIEVTTPEEGRYVFKNLTPGKVVTLYASPKNENGDKTYTGLWQRNSTGETVLGNDVRYDIHTGDAYAFTVANRDMTISYYFNKKSENYRGVIIKGRAVSSAADIKHPSGMKLTSGNVSIAPGVADASVSVLSLDADASAEENGQTYYTTAVTDKNGNFEIFLPGGTDGCAYNIFASKNNSSTLLSSKLIRGKASAVAIELPLQNDNFQIDKMTVGSDMNTDKIAVGDNRIKLGMHLVTADGYREQFVMLRSYDENGNLFREWKAEKSSSPDWSYETDIIPKDYLKENGRLTVEVYNSDGRGMGEVESGYSMYAAPKTASFTLPQFDPVQSVKLPVLGEVSAKMNFGSDSNTTPKEPAQDTGSLATVKESDKHPLEIEYGSGKSIKDAIELAKKDKNYASYNKNKKASLIAANMPNISDKGAAMDEPANIVGGKGKNSLSFDYSLGVYMSMYSQGGKFYFESLTLYAAMTVGAEKTQQFSIVGIPVYLTLHGKIDSKGIINLMPNDADSAEIKAPDKEGWVNAGSLENMSVGSSFLFVIEVGIGAGVGNPKIISAGVDGKMKFDVEYQPWKDGGGIVEMSLDAKLNLGPIKTTYNITKASYGMFKTKGYQEGQLDFTAVKNADKFKSTDSITLLSYDDGTSLTEITGTYGRIDRARSENSEMTLADDNYMPARASALSTVTPKLLPISGGRAIMLSLGDDERRGVNDCSAVTYRIIGADGTIGSAVILDDDNTFDSDLTAARLEDGRILAVWSDVKGSYGDDESVELSTMLNDTDLSLCIFDADGNPGEVRELSSTNGCEGMPRIACDRSTGRTFISYTLTDYETSGVEFGPDKLDKLGDFVYNSYSTVCFKALDEDGSIISEYTPAESRYSEYEAAVGESLDGLRFMDIQLSDNESQARIDEITAAAKDGKAYVVYSLDTNMNTEDDGDRELFMVTYDLTTMEGSGPVRLTDNLLSDTNPQLINYNDAIMLYWSRGGKIAGVNMSGLSKTNEEIKDIGVYSDILSGTEAAAQTFVVSEQPTGDLYLIWNGNCTETSQTGENETRSAVFMRCYDEDYQILDEETGESLGVGMWGEASVVRTAENGSTNINELTCTAITDDEIILSGKETDRSSGTEEYSIFLNIYKLASSVSMQTSFVPEYPMPGDGASITVDAKNYGSLPSHKLTIKAQLMKKDGSEVTELGTKVFDGHVQSASSITECFDFTMPENPEDYSIALTAWENELEDAPCKEYAELPSGAKTSISDIVSEPLGGDKYALGFDIVNSGNKDLDGAVLLIEKAPEHWNDLENTEGYTALTEEISIDTVRSMASKHEYISFNLPRELCDTDDANDIRISVIDADGGTAAQKTVYLNTVQGGNRVINDIYINGKSEPDRITLKRGENTAVEAAVMPITARGAYHISYTSENPDVAEIEPSGTLKGISTGTAKIRIDAYRMDEGLFIAKDNLAFYSDGTPADRNEDGGADAAGEYIAKDAEFTKTVEVSVTGSSSHSSGGGASVKPTASPAPVSTFSPAQTAAPEKDTGMPFTDVKTDDWFYDNVRYAYENKLFSGVSDTLFAPDDPMTRAMLVTVLYRAEGEPDMNEEIWGYPFEDVDAESWYGAAVYWARNRDIVQGYSEDKFAPDAPVTREQIAAILYRYAEFKGISTKEIGDLSQFTDAESISKWAQNDVGWAIGKGLLTGKGNGVLDPNGNATRAEVAAILQRFN